MNLSDRQLKEEEGDLNLREIVDLVWSLRYWIILSVSVALCIAAVYLYTQPKIYQSDMMIMITTDKNAGMGSSAEVGFLQNMTGIRTYNSLANEKVILKSTPVLQSVVEELDLNIRYYVKHNLVNREVGVQEVKMTYLSDPNFNVNNLHTYTVNYNVIDTATLKISVLDQTLTRRAGTDVFAYKDTIVHYNENIPLADCGSVNFTFMPKRDDNLKDFKYRTPGKHTIQLYSPLLRARQLARQISVVEGESKASRLSTSSMLQLVIDDNLPARAEAVLEKMVEKYNAQTKAYYSSSNSNTMEFIQNRLEDLYTQLSAVEGQIKDYSINHEVVNIESQASIKLTTDQQIQDQVQEIDVQLRLMEMVEREIKNSEPYTSIPSNVGISDASINSSITNYNQGCMERARLLGAATTNSPVVQQLSKQLDEQLSLIEKIIDNQISVLEVRRSDLSKKLSKSKNYLQSIPGQKINLAQIEREHSIIEPLYTLLQKKREETMLAIVAEPDIARIVEHSENTAVQVGPHDKRILGIGFLIGFMIPVCLVYVLRLLKTKIETPEDISRRTSLPIIGVVPKGENKILRAADVINGSTHSTMSEIFRSIRTNIGFMPGKVLQMTSSVPGEGKSFVSANLVLSMAQIGKKVVLVETDMRKGHQNRVFDLPRQDHKGLANYLSGDIKDWRETVKHVEGVPTLDVVLKGAVPPNPNELLACDRMDKMIEEMKEIYDYIILDSPPYLVIADPVTLNRLVDRTIYVMRANKADLRFTGELNAAAQAKRLTNPMIILNDVEMEKRSYGYGSHYGYGYGYGYGYAYGYDEQKERKKGLRYALKKLFFRK